MDLIRRVVDAGVFLAANSDAHHPQERENVNNAVALLQRAGAPPDLVVNTWPQDRFLAWIMRRRG